MAGLLLSRHCSRIPIFLAILAFFSYLHHFMIPSYHLNKSNNTIPNLVHFVYILKDPNDDFSFHFRHYLSVFSIIYHCRPKIIYLHTNANNDSIQRAQDGRAGKWNTYIFNLPDIVFNHVEVPTHAGNGQEIMLMEHKSDFVRVRVVRDFGGLYADFDVYALKDPRDLFESGYGAIVGREDLDKINSGIFMSVQHGTWITQWATQMHKAFDGRWATHTDELITIIGETLAAYTDREVLILDQSAFCPYSWVEEAVKELFQAHVMRGQEDSSAEVSGLQQKPSWVKDWDSTYFLHAFHISTIDAVTPQYILDNNSNFGRALYPLTKHMLDTGLISINDLGT